MMHYKDIFISYGRRESLGLVSRLHQQLKLAGYDVWFDKVNIPDGEDYASRIMHGIESAHNFIYVMSPRSLSSPYCLIEIEYARFLGKRVIPINQMIISQTEEKKLSEEDQQVLRNFYLSHGLNDPHLKTTQQVLDQSLKVIGRTDWLDGKEILSENDCNQLSIWAKTYENHWHKHEDIGYLQTIELPQFGNAIDSLNSILERLFLVLNRHQKYVKQHTHFLNQALNWSRNHRSPRDLLVGKEREAAEDWLITDFKEGEQLPCTPPFLLCEFISESKRNALNLFSDIFLCHSSQNSEWVQQISSVLFRQAITIWRREQDVQGGMSAIGAIQTGIIQANTILFLVSQASLKETQCLQELQFAAMYGKRIIPVFCEQINSSELPDFLKTYQIIEYNQDFSKIADKLLAVLTKDHDYFYKYTVFLAAALKWQGQNKNQGLLLRGFNLENAELWLTQGQQRIDYKPIALHYALINASQSNKGQEHTEVFISYSRKDSGFARRLNSTLQNYGKVTWFDQESIAEGSDFHKEIYKGIENADNFVFILSPDAVDSEYCADEVAYAARLNKRIIPILYRDVSTAKVPLSLTTVQWSNFKAEEKEFDVAFRQLIITLETDRDHVEEHTRWLQRAMLWEKHQFHDDFLLSTSEFEQAEQWLEIAQTKNPPPTELQINLVKKSEYNLLFKARLLKSRSCWSSLFLMLVCLMFFTFNEVISLRSVLVRHTSVLAMMLGNNSTASLSFQDRESAIKILATLRLLSNITAAVIYDNNGDVFASYKREGFSNFKPLPVHEPIKEFTEASLNIFEEISYYNQESKITEKIGTIFIQSDLSIIYPLLKTFFTVMIISIGSVLLVLIYLKSKWRLKKLARRDMNRRRGKSHKPKISSYYEESFFRKVLLQIRIDKKS